MKGISFVISATTNSGHPLPFKVKLPNGKSAEIQHSLRESFDVFDVIAELRLLATNLETTASLITPLTGKGPVTIHDPATLPLP
jgi:hypothetical protein